MICIIIPSGSKVIPLNYYAQKEEYEILLSAEGKLHYTGDIHPEYKIPIFIYFDSYAKMKHHYNSLETTRSRRSKHTTTKSRKNGSKQSKSKSKSKTGNNRTQQKALTL
jgi:hypothetical protein